MALAWKEVSLDVGSQVPLERTAASRDGSEMCAPDEQLVIVLEQQRPFRSVELWSRRFRLDGVAESKHEHSDVHEHERKLTRLPQTEPAPPFPGSTAREDKIWILRGQVFQGPQPMSEPSQQIERRQKNCGVPHNSLHLII